MKKTAILTCLVIIFALATLCLVACDGETYTLSTATNLEGAGTYTQIDGDNIAVGESVTLTVTTNEGYEWLGWYVGEWLESKETTYTFEMPSRDITYTAMWRIATYNVSYYVKVGDSPYSFYKLYSRDFFQYNTPSFVLKEPNVYGCEYGYSFDGWYDNKECKGNPITHVPLGSIGSMNLYTNLLPIDYNIEYHLDGGINDIKNPTQYNVENDVTLSEPTKAGYSFDGWYLDEAFTRRVDEFDKMWCQNVDLYAHFYPFETEIDDDGKVTIVSYCGTGTIVEIPKTINGREVVKVNRGVLSDCSGIIDLTVPFVGEYIKAPEKHLGGNIWEIEQQFLGQLFGADNYANQNDFVPNTLKTVKVTGGYTIDTYAFYGCENLTSISLPSCTLNLGTYAISGCQSLSNLEVEEGDNNRFYSKGNCILNSVSVVMGCVSSKIPDDGSVNSIGPNAFVGCKGLRKITIPNTINSIALQAFYDCSDLAVIVFGDNITEIGVDCFENTPWYSNQPNGIVYISKVAYKYKGRSYMPADTSITIKDGIETIHRNAFENCNNLTSIVLPNSLKRIEKYAFLNCSNLTSITIPANVIEIGRLYDFSDDCLNPFASCINLNSIEVDENNEVYHSAGNCLIETATKTLLAGSNTSVIPDDGSVTTINENAFVNLIGLTRVVIPNGVTSIDRGAFEYCQNLTEIVIPSSVEIIDRNLVINCKNLTSIVVDEGNEKYISVDNCLIDTESKTLISGCKTSVIPTDGSVTRIGSEAFFSVKLNQQLVIPNSITYIGYMAFFVDYYYNTGIHFLGTMEEWNAIEKECNFGKIPIICTDGTINERV
ncbi:MAG: leucine-rich repeat protein [Christensenellales bacterium]